MRATPATGSSRLKVSRSTRWTSARLSRKPEAGQGAPDLGGGFGEAGEVVLAPSVSLPAVWAAHGPLFEGDRGIPKEVKRRVSGRHLDAGEDPVTRLRANRG